MGLFDKGYWSNNVNVKSLKDSLKVFNSNNFHININGRHKTFGVAL